jgi:hypothetical protein
METRYGPRGSNPLDSSTWWIAQPVAGPAAQAREDHRDDASTRIKGWSAAGQQHRRVRTNVMMP